MSPPAEHQTDLLGMTMNEWYQQLSYQYQESNLQGLLTQSSRYR